MNGTINVHNQSYNYEGLSCKGAEFLISLPLFEKKYFSPEILDKIEEYSCYRWDKNVEKFIKINLSNDKLVLKNIADITGLLFKYNIRSKVLENQDIKVYF